MMNEETPAIHIINVYDDDSFPVCVYSNAIPRVGDRVEYWVDYPSHKSDLREVEEGEPQRISGKVEEVVIEYRVIEYGNTRRLVSSVLVYLGGYKVTLYPQAESS